MKKYLYTLEFTVMAHGSLGLERDNPNLTQEELEETLTDEEIRNAEAEIAYRDIEYAFANRFDLEMREGPEEIKE